MSWHVTKKNKTNCLTDLELHLFKSHFPEDVQYSQITE